MKTFLKKTFSGYVHKGVPIPSPPQEVLDLSKNYTEKVFLILFFDAKRTWQWLPAEKLELLGVDIARDESKVLIIFNFLIGIKNNSTVFLDKRTEKAD